MSKPQSKSARRCWDCRNCGLWISEWGAHSAAPFLYGKFASNGWSHLPNETLLASSDQPEVETSYVERKRTVGPTTYDIGVSVILSIVLPKADWTNVKAPAFIQR